MRAEVVSGVQDEFIVDVVGVHNVRLGGYTHFTLVHIDPKLIKYLFIIMYVLVFFFFFFKKKRKKRNVSKIFFVLLFFLFFFDFLESFFEEGKEKNFFVFSAFFLKKG